MRKHSKASRNAPPRRLSVARAVAVALPRECTLGAADALKLRLLEQLRNVKRVTLDAAAVQRIDTAALQLLAAFVRDRLTGALPVGVSAPSAPFAQAARLLGLQELLSAAPAAAIRAQG
jgi:anti-anti-sigma regulatory factor